jgi:hypothetical protein
MKSNRRTFVVHSIAGAGFGFDRLVQAQVAAPLVVETEPQAVASGLQSDTTKVDRAKYPSGNEQNCANCALYQEQANRCSRRLSFVY